MTCPKAERNTDGPPTREWRSCSPETWQLRRRGPPQELPESNPSPILHKGRTTAGTVPMQTPLGCHPAWNNPPVGSSLVPWLHQFLLPDSQEPPSAPSTASLPAPPRAAAEPFLPLFPPLKQGKQGGNSKAKGKNTTTKHRIICVFHHLAEGIF